MTSDSFVKSPSTALSGGSRHCGVPLSTPHSSILARLVAGAFYFAIRNRTFYETITSEYPKKRPYRPSRITRYGIDIRFVLLLFLLAAACRQRQAPLESPAAANYPHYSREFVRVAKGTVRVVDGDTFEAGGLTVRVLGVDTPERGQRGEGDTGNEPFGQQATRLTRKLLTEARAVEYLPAEKDRYGRLLAHVFVDGKLLAVELIETCLAYETVSFYGDNGFPDLAYEIGQAAQRSATPKFMEPYRWRQLQRSRK